MATPPVPDSSFETARSNLETLDTYLNATSGVAINREGLALTPIPQVVNQLNTLVSSTAWLPLTGTFTTGATLTERNHILLNPANSQYYSWGGTLPKVVPASSTPASTGGIALNAWVLRQTDASLRSELGTAAFANVQTSATDASTPSALMRRGDWGFGEGADGSVTTIDCNTLANTQIVQVQSASTNGPTNYSGVPVSMNGVSLLHLQWGSSSSAYQVAWLLDSRRFERQKVAGIWDAQWRDVTAGIGIATTQDINCDTITYGGLYRATTGTLPNGTAAHVIHLNRAKDLQAAQIFIDDDEAGEVSVRNRRGDGVWRARKKLYHSQNLLYLQNTSGGSVNPNANVAGSALTPAQTGTWKCWASAAVANNGYCIWNRVA